MLDKVDTRIKSADRILTLAATKGSHGFSGSFTPADYVRMERPNLYIERGDVSGERRHDAYAKDRETKENSFRTFYSTIINSLQGRLWRVRHPDGTFYTLRCEPTIPDEPVRTAERFHLVLWDPVVPMPRQEGLPAGCELTFEDWPSETTDPDFDFGEYKSLHLVLIRRHARDNAVVAANMAYIDGGTNVESSLRRKHQTHPPPTKEQIDAVIMRAQKEPEAFFFVGLDAPALAGGDRPIGYGSLWKCRPEHEPQLLESLDADGNVPDQVAVYGMEAGSYVAWVSSLRILPEHRERAKDGKRSGARVALAHSFERMLIAYARAGVMFDHVWVKASHVHERAYCQMLTGDDPAPETMPDSLKRFGKWVCKLRLKPWGIREGKWLALHRLYT